MTRSRSVLCSKIFAGSSLIIAMIGVSACTSTPGAQGLAVSSFPQAPTAPVYTDMAGEAAAEPVRAVMETAQDTTQADLMPIGGPTAAPSGFLDLCSRSPVDCSHSDTYNPEKIRTLARAATVERYRLAFAALRRSQMQDANADMQSAAVSPAAGDDAPAAANDTVHYLNWSNQGPVGYVQPLQRDPAPGAAHGWRALPGLVAPAANGYVSDFLDLSVAPGGWTQLGAASPAPAHPAGDVQPGAVADGADGGSLLSWSHKSESVDYAAVVEVSTQPVRAPSIQYDIPNEPYDWAHVHVPAPIAQPSVPLAQPEAQTMQAAAEPDQGAEPSDYTRIDMNARTANIVRNVNDQVNRIMRGATDAQVYHVSDYWNAPDLVAGVRGDCEDFALEKRRLLIANGIPAAAISIAIVRTRVGDDHAVLIVSSRQGDYVLDNLQYDVRPWRKAGYTWISRQGPGDDLSWVSLAPANNRTRSPWQGRTVRVAYAQ